MNFGVRFWNDSHAYNVYLFLPLIQSKAYTRNITKDQFRRILDFLTLNVGDNDFKLLCRKFEEPISGDINYPAFVQAIDKGQTHLPSFKASSVI